MNPAGMGFDEFKHLDFMYKYISLKYHQVRGESESRSQVPRIHRSTILQPLVNPSSSSVRPLASYEGRVALGERDHVLVADCGGGRLGVGVRRAKCYEGGLGGATVQVSQSAII